MAQALASLGMTRLFAFPSIVGWARLFFSSHNFGGSHRLFAPPYQEETGHWCPRNIPKAPDVLRHIVAYLLLASSLQNKMALIILLSFNTT
eukprot:m.39936 g.39936  ORF g.39936 m.39936 type:complete len:91 (+) comp11669_c0_seq2:907-1179(+)